MNLTTTRAAQTACAEPGIAPRGQHPNTAIEPGLGPRSGDHGPNANGVQDVGRLAQPANEALGLVLLGIGYESSVA